MLAQTFIADIRNCSNKEQEKIRVDKELGKIRKKFASGNTVTGGYLLVSDTSGLLLCGSLTAHWLQQLTDTLRAEYDKQKYVWKLLYIYMLGYEVEFGHKQAADLIPASKCACLRLARACFRRPPLTRPVRAGMLRSRSATWRAPSC